MMTGEKSSESVLSFSKITTFADLDIRQFPLPYGLTAMLVCEREKNPSCATNVVDFASWVRNARTVL